MVDSLINKLMIVLNIWLLFSISINYECMRLPRSGLHVFPVDTCPKNLSEVEAASRRLNCSGIQEFEYVYHCLPRFDLSHLVEFCYDDISGWTEPGNCMVLHTQTLNNHPCKYFTKGCPNKPYLTRKMYNYPACIDIDRKEKCYRMDPNCTSITRSPMPVKDCKFRPMLGAYGFGAGDLYRPTPAVIRGLGFLRSHPKDHPI
ncbi:uncharacterized protein LOC125653410 [Ostrea edulis]|uniref:uncharacterized protein LOC125653410 n=1 Tax=Ostrea edulis TaxID=37623 RepID=UPI0024AFAC7B|nr:uncharacterized protein LOC125653410 [Ostrea edulis]